MFPLEDQSGKRVDIDDNESLGKVVSYAVGTCALTLFIVWEDDPYLMIRSSDGNRVSPFEEKDTANSNSDNNRDDNSNGIDSSSDESNDSNGAWDIEAQNEDGNESEIQLQENANSDSDNGGRNTIDERKYKKFELGRCYSTIQSFKSAVTKYAVKKKYDISYFKTDSKRVVAVCCRRTCPWRICASINSTSSRVVVRSVQAEHNCTWQGKVYLCLLTHA
ncbi:unnamed protein product [Thlaspi arvense]|uniref:Transposase MuDR plant domain-containing protein n=1 Tax=Thlaspi arvense TaxID=13288 RepID=A0AAU9T6K0_THLAR|nr:unnamed protein product [Thlaspi arvense]